MSVLADIKATIAEKLAAGSAADFSAQVVILVIAVGIGLFLHVRWARHLDVRLPQLPEDSPKALMLRGSRRIVLPVFLALVALIAHSVWGALGHAVGLLDIAVPLMLALALIRLLVFLLRNAAGPETSPRGWEIFISTTIWLGGALYLLGWLPTVSQALDGVAITLGSFRISFLSVAKLLVFSSILLLLVLWISRLIEGRIAASSRVDAAVGAGVSSVIKYGLIALAFLIAISSAGIDLTALAFLGGALGVGIGFGLQKVTSNLISGFLLLFDRSIRPGDVISIGENFGWVQKLGARYIVVRDRNGVDTLIPNEQLITSQVTNWSYGDRHIRVKIPVQISYEDDPELAIRLMREASGVSDRVLIDPPPACRLLGFGDNGINLELRVWIDDPEEGVNNVRTEINLEIWRRFREHNITIPFPQRDLHLKSGSLSDGPVSEQPPGAS